MTNVSHVSGGDSQPTPAQMKEFYAQVESGQMTKRKLQMVLSGDFKSGIVDSFDVEVDNTVNFNLLFRILPIINLREKDISGETPVPRSKRSKITREYLCSFSNNISSYTSEDVIAYMALQGLVPANMWEMAAFHRSKIFVTEYLGSEEWSNTMVMALGTRLRHHMMANEVVPGINARGGIAFQEYSTAWKTGSFFDYVFLAVKA